MKKYINTSKALWKDIIKCALAYEICMILVLIHKVNAAMGGSSYIAVLGTIFFKAGGTAGNQIVEIVLNIFTMTVAMVWCLIFAYLCSLYNSRIESHNLYSNGAGIIAAFAFFFCVLAIAYARIKYPRLFLPALQGFTIPFFGLTKGIYNTQVDAMTVVINFYPCLIGGGIALLVNLLLWPETAAKNSEASFRDALTSIQAVLEFIDEDVLKEDNTSFVKDTSVNKKLHQNVQKLNGDITRMKAAKKDAKYEIVISHYKPAWYKAFGKTLEDLYHHLYIFSRSVERESQIMKLDKIKAQLKAHRGHDKSPLRYRGSISDDLYITSPNATVADIDYNLIFQLQQSIQPEIKVFIQACIRFIHSIQYRLEENKAISKSDSALPHCKPESLVSGMQSLREAKIIMQQRYEERRAEPTEDHFLIATLLFSLIEFGNTLNRLDAQINQLISQRTRSPRIFFPSVNFRKWLKKSAEKPDTTEQVLFDQQILMQKEQTHSHKDGESVQNDKDQEFVPLQNSPGPHFWNKWLFVLNEFFKTEAVCYGIKFAITTEILALMAWLPIPGVNEIYNNNHGQWALLSCMVVFNYTVGNTTWQCFFRVLATIIGAVCGYICLLAGNRTNPYIIAVLVGVFQVPFWYIFLATKYPRIGFISVLTLAVIVCTGYMDLNDEDLFAPVWKRTLTAIAAIILVMIVDQLVWPAWARRLVREHLSNLLIATGIQYSKVASLICQENTQSFRYQDTLEDCQYNSKILRKQYQLTNQMLGLAAMEPRFTKGPFPISVYRDLLDHECNILFWIEHLIFTQSFVSENVRRRLMNPVNAYRKELAAAVHLYLFTLAGSLKTKSSLPASLPSAESARKILHARQMKMWDNHFDEFGRLEEDDDDSLASTMAGERQFEEDIIKQQEKGAENNMYWQTYAAGSIEIIGEQEAMGRLVSQLMGQHAFRAATKDWIT